MAPDAFVDAVLRNLVHTEALFDGGGPPEVLATVAGSATATAFWQRELDRMGPELGARVAVSLHEDLPTNQAFGLLLLWHRLRSVIRPGEGALAAFVFGDGTRATPLTEAEAGQKPAIRSFVRASGGRLRTTVELALRTFAPVEAYLRRSGFDGLVVKWGDEVQIPTLDLSRSDRRLAGADVVRFVSMQPITAALAESKDWMQIDAEGRITAFVPRRPLAQVARFAARGGMGGLNLGSIALSRHLLDALLEAFEGEVLDPAADRSVRPDLDPQLFTALTLAAVADPEARQAAWADAVSESAAMQALDCAMPGILDRLVRVLDGFEARHGRPVRLVALDVGDPYWGDVGQHRQMYATTMALRAEGPRGRIARTLAGIDDLVPDALGNRITPGTVLGPGVHVRGSVLIDVQIQSGSVVDSVLIGTRGGHVQADGAFDLASTARELQLALRAGAYRIVATDPVRAGAGERVTTVFLPDGEVLLRVHEDTDLRDRPATYDVPILGNPMSFRAAHEAACATDPGWLDARRDERCAQVRASFEAP